MAKLIDITGKALSGEWGTDDETGNGTPVLRTTNFTNEGVVDYKDVVIRSIVKKKIEEKYLRKGDIIIEKSGGSDKQPVGRVIYFDGPENTFLFNNFTGLLRVQNQSEWYPRYVFYSLYANYRRGGTRAFENKTTGLHNLKTDDYVSRHEVADADIAKQIGICDQLDCISDIIRLRQDELQKLDELVKARFVEMFGIYPANPMGWETGKIRDTVADVRYGSSRPAVDGGKYPYLRMNNITYGGELDLSDVKRIDVPENPAKSSVIGTMQYLLPKDNVLPEYLCYVVRHMHLEKYFTGATIPHIYFRDYKNEQFNLDSLDKQAEIIEILGKAESIILKRRKELAELDNLVKARFVEMFGDMYLNTMEWRELHLETMADIVSGITKGRKIVGKQLTKVPYMAVSNVKDGYIDWTTVKTIEATDQEINQYRLLPDDVLMTEGGDPDKLGRGAIIRTPLENCIHQNHIFRVRLDESHILPDYFAEYLKHQRAKRYFLGCAKQTTGITATIYVAATDTATLPLVSAPIAVRYRDIGI